MEKYRDQPLTDRIPEQLVAHHTMVAVRSDRYPERTRRFLHENYLWSGRLLIAGLEVHENAGGSFRFNLSLGGSYVFLSKGHLLSGKLNGVPISGRAEMQPGLFEFDPDTADWPVTIQWERAYQAGIIGNCDANLPWHGARPRSLVKSSTLSVAKKHAMGFFAKTNVPTATQEPGGCGPWTIRPNILSGPYLAP